MCYVLCQSFSSGGCCCCCFGFLANSERNVKFPPSATAASMWQRANGNVLLMWSRLKLNTATIFSMCWYDTSLSPYWIFMLQWNSDLQWASVGSHIALARPAFAQHTWRNCYGNWLLWVMWHHHILICWGGRGSWTTKARDAGKEGKLLFWFLNEWRGSGFKKLSRHMASGRQP